MLRSVIADRRALLRMWDEGGVKLVVLCPVGRSGSLFIQSLFDSHPEVVTFPHWFYDHYDSFSCVATDTAGIKSHVRGVVERNIGVFDGSRSFFGDSRLSRGGKLGPRGDEVYRLDVERFCDEVVQLLANGPISARRFLLAAHLALALVTDRDPGAVRFVLFHDHLIRSGVALARDFGGAQLLVTTRDPRENINSFQRLFEERAGHGHVFGDVFAQMRVDAQQALRADEVARAVAGRVRYLDLNRMHAAQEHGMRALAAWLGLAWNTTLLESTVLGSAWHGNATDRTARTGFDRKRVACAWPKQQSPAISRLIEHFFFDYMRAMRFLDAPRQRPSRAEAMRTLWLHDPLPAFFPLVGADGATPGSVIDGALSDPPSSFKRAWPLHLQRWARALYRVSRLYEEANKQQLRLLRDRYRSESLNVFHDLESRFYDSSIDESCFIGLDAQEKTAST